MVSSLFLWAALAGAGSLLMTIPFSQKRSRKAGLPPGTLVHLGPQKEGPVKITLFDYDTNNFIEQEIRDVQECYPYRDKPSITWINVDGIHKTGIIRDLGKNFGLHPLSLEDIVNTNQRPKLEDYGDYLYLVLKMLHKNKQGDGVIVEQVSLIVGNNFVLSFQETVHGDVFDPIREQIRSGKGRLRKMGADYLAYALIDTIIDYYFVVLETLGEKIESLEEETATNPNQKTLRNIHVLKRDMLFLRRAVWPLREVLTGLGRCPGLISDSIALYLRDAYDHTIQIMDTIENYREMLSGMLDIYLSSINNRLNEIIKVLTIITTIFMPLSVITGLYGMNFKNIPGAEAPQGFFEVIGFMVIIAVLMLLYFKRKKWI
jgi:magnesium transporter